MKIRFLSIFPAFGLILLFSLSAIAENATQEYKIGYFEAGPNGHFTLLRGELRKVLELNLPKDKKIVFAPEAYRTGSWNQDSCRIAASELANLQGVDFILTFGPWVVEDLLAAGCKTPIIAMHRFAPVTEKIADRTGKPLASNLTLQIKPGKIASDLQQMIELTGAKKIGFLFFPSGDEHVQIFEQATIIAKTLNVELVTADTYNKYGTYAYFKSFQALPKDIDALYVGPTWALDQVMTSEFFGMLNLKSIPSFSWEGDIAVQKGAFASVASLSFISDARFAADKIIAIINGATPADLPTIMPEQVNLIINKNSADSSNVKLKRNVFYSAQVIPKNASAETEFTSLLETLNRATYQNPAIIAGDDRISAAESEISRIKANYLPRISLGLRGSYIDDNSVNNSHNWLKNESYSATLEVDQTIFSAKLLKAAKSASIQKQLVSADQKVATSKFELAVTVAYLDFMRSVERWTIESQNRDHLRLYGEMSRANIMIHNTDSVDYPRWMAEWQNSTTDVLDAYYNMKIASVTLSALLNLPPDYPFNVDSISYSEERLLRLLRNLFFVTETDSEISQFQNFLLNTGMEISPGLKRFDTYVGLLYSQLDEASAGAYPNVGLKATLRNSDYLENYPPPFVQENNSWSVMALLNFPLFDKRTKHEKAVLKANISATEFIRDSLSLRQMRDISHMMYTMLSYSDRIIVAHRHRKSARLALEQMVTLYDLREADQVRLLDAQQSALLAERKMIHNRYGFYFSIAELMSEVGFSSSDGGTFDQLFDNLLAQLVESTGRPAGEN